MIKHYKKITNFWWFGSVENKYFSAKSNLFWQHLFVLRKK
jgi:hypothetical protein